MNAECPPKTASLFQMSAGDIRFSVMFLVLLVANPVQGEILFTRRIHADHSDKVASAESTIPFLQWNNGEILHGELDSATADQVRWKSNIFSEPITLLSSRLKMIESPKNGINSQEPLAVSLKNGDLIYGTLVSINAESVRLRSGRGGELTLRRGEVVSLSRVTGGRLVYSTPSPGMTWKVKDDRLGSARTLMTAWKPGSRRKMELNGWNRTNYLPLKLPVKVEVEFQVQASTPPRFRLDLNSSAGASPSIETWDDILVIVYGSRFAPLRNLKTGDRDVSLRLCWDREERRCVVFDAAGKEIAELTQKNGPRRGLSETGIYIQNTGMDLTLASLRVREWNSAAPSKPKTGLPQVILDNGDVETGSIVAADSISIWMKTSTSGEKSMKLNDIETIILSAATEKHEKARTNEIAFADGSFISGELNGIKNGIASLNTSWSAQPVSVKIEGMQNIRFAAPAKADEPEDVPLDKLDRLVSGKTSLRGRPVGSGDEVLRWLPTGGVRPETPSMETGDIQIIRTIQTDAPAVKAQTLFFVDNGDVLPGVLDGMDENFIHLKSALAEYSRISAPLCYAVQFPGPEVRSTDFDDPGWRRIKGDTKNAMLNGGTLMLTSGGVFGHPSMMQTDELKFSLSAQQGYGVIRLRLFTDDFKAATRGVPVLLMRSGDQISCGIESAQGNNFESRGQFSSPYGKNVEIRLVVQEKTVEVLVGDVSIGKLPAPPEKRAGLGIAFELANVMGNGERPMTISDFSARPNLESIWFPAVDGEARKNALTLPRFRRDDPPAHVLVANNGDLLRGRITAATSEHIRFQSGLELLNVPRNRVSAAIRLTPPAAGSTAGINNTATDMSSSGPSFKPTHWLLLRNGGRLGLAVEKFTSDMIIGRSANFGRCEVPMDMVQIVRFSPPMMNAAMSALRSWKLEHTIDPVLPESGGQSSPLLGKDAKDFKLKRLDGTSFELSKARGSVVVLDFWATWCGPCVKSLPEMIEVMREFDSSKAMLIGVNQAESAPVVQKFLEQRGWNLTVALDAEQNVGRQFGVEGIPHTVIVGPDGKIAWVKTGYDPGGAKEAANTVRKLLETGID